MRLLLLCFALSLATTRGFSQTFNMDGTPIVSCGGSFFDSGGQAGNYGNNQNLTTTICSDGSSGTHIRLTFSGIQLAGGDVLCFYDGPNVNAPLLACSTDYPPGQPFIVQATAENPSGCLTVTFNSDAGGNGAGWSSVISCVSSCQTVLADLVSSNPAAVPVDTGWIDLCPGERVFFTGKGLYPQSGFAYPQSDFSTTFEWNFGDGDIGYGPITSHKFDKPGGYYVQLFLTDTFGCRSTNFINQRIRVAPRPTFNLAALDNTICSGDTIHLSAAVDSSSGKTLLVSPANAAFEVEGSRSDSLALPDGTGIPYQTSVFFSEFSPGQILTNPDDLESICVNMEHSWMRDMEISITCPNGQSIILHNFGGQTGSQVFLGEPNDMDGFNPIPGVGYDYCWTNNAPNPTWLEYANTVLGGNGTLPSGDYTPFEPFSDLVGCPLNGEWTISVEDLWPIDNGYIFSWSIKFNDLLYPTIEQFSPQFVSCWGWSNHPSIFYSSTDSIAAAPQNAGTAGYTFHVTDEFGCTWDTLVSIKVLPFTHPNCFICTENYNMLSDTAVCAGEPVQLDATSQAPAVEEVRFESYPDYPFGFSNHPPSNPYGAPISINSVGFPILTNPILQITSVCIDIETDFDSDLNIYLRSPDGKQLELSTGNGGSGDNYKITCFTPSAVTPIIGSPAPFNGTFKPEGAWTSLNNAVVNGDWKLMVSDGFGPTQFSKLKWWSIGFNYPNNVTYSWTNAATLSCNNCPNPVATPNSSSTYIVTAKDGFNCIHKDTVQIDINTLFPAPANLQMVVMSAGDMIWQWSAVSGASGYEVSVNGGPWMAPNGLLSHTVSGLVSGDPVQIQVRCLGSSPNCPPDIASANLNYFDCTLDASLNSSLPAECSGSPTGSAVISVANGTAPIQFFVNNNPVPYPNGNLNKILPAGQQRVIAVDVNGCRDTVSFQITEPAPVLLSAQKTDVLCNGGASGTATAMATGGTGTVNYAWQACTGGPVQNLASISGLIAGCYNVIATDGNGCSATQSVTVGQPTGYNVVFTQDSVTCFGLSDGSATANVSGATSPYIYLWDNGATTPTATGLNAGPHTVSITDANGCMISPAAQVLQPQFALNADSNLVKDVTCFGGNNGTASVIPTGGTAPYTYIWNNGQSSQKAQVLVAGIYTVTVTDQNGCSVTNSLTVQSPAQIIVTFQNTQQIKCFGNCDGASTAQVTGGILPYAFFWDTPGIPNGIYNPINLCAGVYGLSVLDANGCEAFEKLLINPAPPAIQSHYTIIKPSCAGVQNGSIAAVLTGGTQTLQQVWSTGATSATVQNLNCGTYYVTITDAVGCSKIDTIVVDCPQVIQVNNIQTSNVSCFAGSNGTATVLAQGGSGILKYLWSDPAAQVSAVAGNLQAGTYTVTITDINGCSASASATVLQPTALGVTLIQNNVSCPGDSNGSLEAVPGGGTLPYQYIWSVPGSGSMISGLAIGQYQVTVTDANNCTATAQATITEPATPIDIQLTQIKKACFEENNAQVQASASGSNGAPFTFLWSNGQSGSVAQNLSKGSISVTATDSKGCTASDTIAVEQWDSIDVNIVLISAICYGSSDGVAVINYVTGGAGGGDTLLYNYQWKVPGGGNGFFVTGLAGNKTYQLVVTDLDGCSNTFPFFINQPPALVLETTATDVSCNGLSDGAAVVNNIIGAVGNVVYRWDNNYTGIQNNNLFAGTYLVTATDQRGCTVEDIVIVAEPTPLNINFAITDLICHADSNAVIKALASGGTPPYSMSWSNGTTGNSISQLPAGDYDVSLTDAHGCTVISTIPIPDPAPVELSLATTEPHCFGAANGHLNIAGTGGAKPYRYSINGGQFGGASTVIGLKAGHYSVVLKDNNGCTATDTTTISQPLPVLVDLGPDTTIIFGQQLILSADVINAFGLLDYGWKSMLVDSLTCIDTAYCDEIQITPALTNVYRLLVTDANGCTGYDEMKVFIEKPRGVYVPTAFSPNGDLNNDLLQVHGKSTQVKRIVEFRIYDRWGELIYTDKDFQVNDSTRGWDGSWRGQNLDPGVYVWYLEAEYLDGFHDFLSGNVTLIK